MELYIKYNGMVMIDGCVLNEGKGKGKGKGGNALQTPL